MAYFFDMRVKPVKITGAVFVPSGSGTRVHRDRPSHGLAYQISGELNYVFSDGPCIKAMPGDLVYLPKHSDYDAIRVSDGDCYAINFDLSEPIDASPCVLSIPCGGEMVRCFEDASEAMKQNGPGAEESVLSDLYAILAMVRRIRSTDYLSVSQRDILRPALEYMKVHFTEEELHIPALAEMCGISEVYFRRLIHKEVGMTPIKYVNALRLDYAKELLSSGEFTVEQASARSGFRDPCYFSRAFRSRFGVTPGSIGKDTEKTVAEI